MNAKLWNVQYGDHYISFIVNARNIEEAICKANAKAKLYKKENKDQSRWPQIQSVEFIAEED